MSGVKDTDKGYRKLVETVFKMGAPSVSVGIFDTATGDNGESIVDIASWQEFGTVDIPERSFLRAWFDANEQLARDRLANLLGKVLEGKLTKQQALQLFGLWVQGEIQKMISNGIEPALDPETVKRKGSSVPLINTGQLRTSITFKVEKEQ